MPASSVLERIADKPSSLPSPLLSYLSANIATFAFRKKKFQSKVHAIYDNESKRASLQCKWVKLLFEDSLNNREIITCVLLQLLLPITWSCMPTISKVSFILSHILDEKSFSISQTCSATATHGNWFSLAMFLLQRRDALWSRN
jgi:hypothetical protein